MVVVQYKNIDKTLTLSHHGIKGQKWGKRNGPPYPLDYNSHSVSEKRLNSKSVLGSEQKETKGHSINKELLKKVGKGALVTAGVVAFGAIAYSAIASGKADKLIDAGKAYVDDTIKNEVDSSKLGKSIDQIDRKMVARINSSVAGTKAGQINCFHTTTSYILNSLFGQNVTALGFNGVDEFSGILQERGRNIDLYKSIFDGISVEKIKNQSFNQVFSNLKSGSTGVIGIRDTLGGHLVNFEKDLDGNVTIIDAQGIKNQIFDSNKWASVMESLGYEATDIIDFSQARLKENANEILQYIVKS